MPLLVVCVKALRADLVGLPAVGLLTVATTDAPGGVAGLSYSSGPPVMLTSPQDTRPMGSSVFISWYTPPAPVASCSSGCSLMLTLSPLCCPTGCNAGTKDGPGSPVLPLVLGCAGAGLCPTPGPACPVATSGSSWSSWLVKPSCKSCSLEGMFLQRHGCARTPDK
jgi:hypothetical protein